MLREHALYTVQSWYGQHPQHRPRLELLVDLTSLEKTGKFTALTDWVHIYNGAHGVHLVVLYLCYGPLRLPWAFQIWRGKGIIDPRTDRQRKMYIEGWNCKAFVERQFSLAQRSSKACGERYPRLEWRRSRL